MGFIDARLNSNYRFGFRGGPQFNTLRVELMNGRVVKNRQWLYPLGKWTTDYALLSPAEREAMRGAIWACGGGFSDFRFRDWDDYRAVRQKITVVAGTKTPAQLVRNYTFGTTTFSRPITLPLSPTLYDEDGTPITATVNPLTGMATPAADWPAKDVFWDGEFDVRACFQDDYNPLTWEAGNVATCPVVIIESRG